MTWVLYIRPLSLDISIYYGLGLKYYCLAPKAVVVHASSTSPIMGLLGILYPLYIILYT